MPVLVAVLAGTLMGATARLGWPQTHAARPVAAPRGTITVSGREEVFSDLQSALQATPDGGVITLEGPGPFRTSPLLRKGKALTLRAAPGDRPRIERLAARESAWDALIASDRDLRLEGLDLGDDDDDQVVPLISMERARLTLSGCRLRSRTSGPLVALRQVACARLERCRVHGRAQGVAIERAAGQPTHLEVIDSKVIVRDVTGVAILLWTGEGADCPPSTIELTRSELDAGRILACRGFGGPVRVFADGSRFTFHQGLINIDACPERLSWRGKLAWRESGNRYRASGAWVRIDGRPAPVWDEASWRRLWTGERR
jgi:hypothetical protein